MIENLLVRHCAQTIGGVKVSNLFNCSFENHEDLEKDIEIWNLILNPNDIYISEINTKNNSSLVFVYKKSLMNQLLKNKNTLSFLKDYGYKKFSLDLILKNIKIKLNEKSDFPHEIGIILGYPIDDVRGFIKNNGKNYKLSGFWKVYSNTNHAINTFNTYKKCSEYILSLFESGIPIHKLTNKYKYEGVLV